MAHSGLADDGDPPLFLGGSRFVDVESNFSTSETATASRTSLRSGLIAGPSSRSRSPPANTHFTVQGPAATTLPPIGAAQPSGDAADADASTAEAVGMLREHARLKSHDRRRCDWMELTRREMEDMVAMERGADTFSVSYFADEVRKVWGEREARDKAPTKHSSVRLLENTSHPGSAAGSPGGSRVLSPVSRGRTPTSPVPGGAVSPPRSVALSHPLVNRGAMRNAERREVFRRAAEERASSAQPRSFADVPPLAGHLSAARRALMDKFPSPATAEAPQPASETDASEGAAEPTPPRAGPQSLSAMLAEQQQQLAHAEEHYVTVYKPVLQAFENYERAVQEKLTTLADIPLSEDAKEYEQRRALGLAE